LVSTTARRAVVHLQKAQLDVHAVEIVFGECARMRHQRHMRGPEPVRIADAFHQVGGAAR
jgi:hypothetical protein